MIIHVYFIQGKHGVIRAKPLILVFMHLFDEKSKTCLPSAPPGKYFKKTNQQWHAWRFSRDSGLSEFQQELVTNGPDGPLEHLEMCHAQATNCASSQAGHCLAPNRSASETWQLHLVQMWMWQWANREYTNGIQMATISQNIEQCGPPSGATWKTFFTSTHSWWTSNKIELRHFDIEHHPTSFQLPHLKCRRFVQT